LERRTLLIRAKLRCASLDTIENLDAARGFQKAA
jgi:hypothetical protein